MKALYNARMKQNNLKLSADKTVTIDGDTHEILRTEAFKSGGKESIKSLIANAVKKAYGDKK